MRAYLAYCNKLEDSANKGKDSMGKVTKDAIGKYLDAELEDH